MTPKLPPLPPEAPVMVLPGSVLFPNAVLPLRIFEPRYRAMLQWALERDRMFCVALMKPGITEALTAGQFFHTAGIGLISASVTQADGTSNLMLQGLARVRLARFRQHSPFRIADIEPIAPAVTDAGKAALLARELRERCSAIRIGDSPLPDSFSELIRTISDSDTLADTVAQSLVSDAFERQAILEEQDTAVRLRNLLRILREQFQAR